MASKARPLILALETATRAGSVCLARGPEVLARLAGSASLSHSTDLIENLEELLRSEHLKLSEVDLFAAASGPGSFTGLRIGLATVKSLAVCARRSCVGISTLAALALREFANGNVISPEELRATYVRPSDAEINEQWQPSTTTGPV